MPDTSHESFSSDFAREHPEAMAAARERYERLKAAQDCRTRVVWRRVTSTGAVVAVHRHRHRRWWQRASYRVVCDKAPTCGVIAESAAWCSDGDAVRIRARSHVEFHTRAGGDRPTCLTT